MNNWHLNQALRALRGGGVIAYPTEAVWGLGCDPFNAAAIERLLELKRRPMHKGLILVAADMGQIKPLLQGLSNAQLEQLKASWPGPVTWLIPDPKGWAPEGVRGCHASVAVRVSAHPVVRALCASYGGPIVSTSANRSAAAPARSKLKVNTYFGAGLDYVVPGSLGDLGRPTQICDLSSNQLIRR
ncbi:L-threonylcarbamoyladenylate synthase [Marinobacterium sedimentorum]|uniref:L-threonylcarbamoyladenylate synthase n=1 Tax=Marinobacterium sedimentorum TaxID=2927804 RepID=UPI0020C69FBC|nr:Sua5/YciO/YrdC/YwlC family protein [Marinobacterium sedimentorum]MCP8688285.1 Sua5/YciO/YrdC/YwlC family protein [Marinobacterium sedimentorum]